ncbi:MAG: hypothetical protein K6G33_14795 [Ruminococcus sp.]|uniref:hypothetical protein n=1 Tax=Ruminococcus sp. TaxID=41978 RepID=UPI0025FC2C41|nr:hypothetical protein [Ruminococcus sp.]MCR5601992.1 hypothetical protein [Ruminococcus sp.]
MKYNIDNNVNNALFERISAVNNIINSFDAGDPPDSFKLGYCADTVKQTKQVCYAMIGAGLLVTVRSMPRSASARSVGIVLGMASFIMAIIYLVYSAKMSSVVFAEINGDKLTVKGRTYDSSDISEISGGALNNLKVMSFGKKVLNINKSCEGCGDLVRWAKKNNIPINDGNTGDAQSIKKRNSTLAAVITVMCIVIAFVIVFLKRM